MIALALICLLLAAAGVALILLVGTGQDVAFSFFAGDFVTRPVWIFVGGAVTLLLAETALRLFRSGTKRKVAQRREIKRLRKVEETSTTTERTQDARGTRGYQPEVDVRDGETLVREPRRGTEDDTNRS